MSKVYLLAEYWGRPEHANCIGVAASESAAEALREAQIESRTGQDVERMGPGAEAASRAKHSCVLQIIETSQEAFSFSFARACSF